MTNKESQPNKDENNESTANVELNSEQQEGLTEQDAAIEAELLTESTEEITEAAGEAERTVIQGSTTQATPKGSSKGWIAVSAVLAILLVIVLIKPPFGNNNETVATVNGVKIGQDKLYDELVLAGGPSTLDNIILQELINQEAKANNVEVTDADVAAEIAMIQKSFATPEEFDAALAQYGLTLESLQKDTRINLTIRKILEPKTDVTAEEVQAYYDENKANLATSPEEVQASHILVATKEEADAIIAQLNQGQDFANLAKDKSTDEGSGANGGDVGFFTRTGMMVEEFSAAAFALQVGETSAPVQSQFGFHIIKKTAVKEAVIPTFEEKKEEIRHQLVAMEASTLSQDWMSEIRTKAKITNTLAPKEPAAG